MGRPARQAPLEHAIADPVRAGPGRGRRRSVLVTGAAGQLGQALAEGFAGEDVRALTRAEWDLTKTFPYKGFRPDLVLHAGAWTDVDAAERDPVGASTVNATGTERAAAIGAPLVYFSSDYVFDGRKGEPYLESDAPNPVSAYGRSKLDGEREAARSGHAWIVRTSWLFGWTSKNFLLTMLRLGRERDEVSIVDDQRGCPTYAGHLAEAVRELVELPFGTYHLAADGDCTWAEFAEAIFDEAALRCRVRRISSADWNAPAPRPAYSVLRSEKPETPRLPHWREGLRACLERVL